METRPGRTPRPPTGETFINRVQAKFIKDGLPALEKNARWRDDSRRAILVNDWPAPRS